jgi:cellulose synthase/poly-beta-1,6-N-acetylglucosamine synthase-like glycosyltransferase
MIAFYVVLAVVFVIVAYTDFKSYGQLYKYYRFYFGNLNLLFKPPPLFYYPHVLIQLPVLRPDNLSAQEETAALYQLMNTIKCMQRLEWAKDRLWIQVIDQSKYPVPKEAWSDIPNIEILHTNIRTGKADNLNYGLSVGFGAKPEIKYVAVFDSDFRPTSSWLLRTIAVMENYNPGCVQTRWTFYNEEASLLTATSSLLLHSHFCIEKVISQQSLVSGYNSYFNGSGGVWSRKCIDACGGWPSVPFAQDLAMSKKAKAKGYRILYDPTIEAPNELPSTWMDFLDQQKRWACGGTMQGNKFWFKTYFCRWLLYCGCLMVLPTLHPNIAFIGMLFTMNFFMLPYYYCVGRISGKTPKDAIYACLGIQWLLFWTMAWASWGVMNAWLPTKKRPSVTTKRMV